MAPKYLDVAGLHRLLFHNSFKHFSSQFVFWSTGLQFSNPVLSSAPQILHHICLLPFPRTEQPYLTNKNCFQLLYVIYFTNPLLLHTPPYQHNHAHYTKFINVNLMSFLNVCLKKILLFFKTNLLSCSALHHLILAFRIIRQ